MKKAKFLSLFSPGLQEPGRRAQQRRLLRLQPPEKGPGRGGEEQAQQREVRGGRQEDQHLHDHHHHHPQVLKKLNISAEEKEKVNIALLAAKGASGESFKSEAAGNKLLSARSCSQKSDP